MIYRVPYSGPPSDPEPVSDRELGIAVMLLMLIVLLAAVTVPLIG